MNPSSPHTYFFADKDPIRCTSNYFSHRIEDLYLHVPFLIFPQHLLHRTVNFIHHNGRERSKLFRKGAFDNFFVVSSPNVWAEEGEIGFEHVKMSRFRIRTSVPAT